MARIKGTLIDGASAKLASTVISLRARSNTKDVIVKVKSNTVTEDGEYDFITPPGKYDVTIKTDGFSAIDAGTIEVFSDSPDGTLNSFLNLPKSDDKTPEFLQDVINNAVAAQKAADEAKASADKLKLSDNIDSTSTTEAATINSVNKVKKLTDDNVAGLKGLTEQVVKNTDGFTQNLSANGWCKLPNGMIMQWGRTSETKQMSGVDTVTLTATLPVTCSKILSLSATASAWGTVGADKSARKDLRTIITPNVASLNSSTSISKFDISITVQNNFDSTTGISYLILCI